MRSAVPAPVVRREPSTRRAPNKRSTCQGTDHPMGEYEASVHDVASNCRTMGADAMRRRCNPLIAGHRPAAGPVASAMRPDLLRLPPAPKRSSGALLYAA